MHFVYMLCVKYKHASRYTITVYIYNTHTNIQMKSFKI
jgi:hypothetical protein